MLEYKNQESYEWEGRQTTDGATRRYRWPTKAGVKEERTGKNAG